MRRSLLDAATLAALFVAALIAALRLAGTSPIVWIDTFNDELEVQQCLAADACTLTGVQTSVPGQVHAVAWLELRTLLAWLGVGIDGTHVVIQLLNALAVLLVFLLATRLGGPLAGAAAAWIAMDHIDALVRTTALYNTAPLLFLGAVFVLACTAVVLRPGVVSVALAALVGAVMSNVHLACVITGASVVWVALTAPRRRLALAAFGAALFALAAVAIAPPSWLHNLVSLLEPRPPARSTAARIVADRALMRWMLFAVGAWVASFASRSPAWVAYRRRVQGALAVIVPFMAAFLVAPVVGLHPESKYLFHLKPACAVAAALPLALVAHALLRALSTPRLLAALERLAPFAAALFIALPGDFGVTAGGFVAADERTPTVADLTATGRILRDEHGWDDARILQGLKTPYGVTVLSGLRQMLQPGEPSPAPDDRSTIALLMMVEAQDLPQPLPSNWTVVRRTSQAATVLVFLQTRIDWSHFEVCTTPADGSPQHCDASGWQFDRPPGIVVPAMPATGQDWRGTILLSLPLRPAAPGFTEQIFMPRTQFGCGGWIASRSGGAVTVAPDRRTATIAPTAAEGPATIKLEWAVGSKECGAMSYDSLPAFFIAGESGAVQLLETMLRRREG